MQIPSTSGAVEHATVDIVACAGIPLERGDGGRYSNDYQAGPIPPGNEPHWRRGGQAHPAVYAINQHDKTLFVGVIPGTGGTGAPLADCKLTGQSEDRTVKIESIGFNENVFLCKLIEYPSVPYRVASRVRWSLATPNTEWSAGQSDLDLFFIFGPPCGVWQDRPLWIEALGFVFTELGIGNGQCTSGRDALARMATRLLTSDQLKYDTSGGITGFGWIPGDQGSQPFRLARFLQTCRGLIRPGWQQRPDGFGMELVQVPKVNCYDMTAAVVILGSLLGLNVRACRFGRDLETNSTARLGTLQNNLRVVGHLQNGVPLDFDTHVVPIYDGRVYDACVAANQGQRSLVDLPVEQYLGLLLASIGDNVITQARSYDVQVQL